jgi:multiple sugar transport system substrate-binding protein
MKKIIKTLAVLLIAAWVPGGLFAAGEQGSGGADQAAGKQKLILLGTMSSLLTGKEDSDSNVLTKLNDEKNIEVELNPGAPDIDGAMQIIFRLGTMPKSEEDLCWLPNAGVDDRIGSYMEPLNSYLAKDPIDGWPSDYPNGFVDTYSANGSVYSIPVRAGVFALYYNKRILEERGIKDYPKTPEELYEVAKKCTYTKPDGTKVYGFMIRSGRFNHNEQISIGARMFGGDLMTQDYKITMNQPPVIKFLQLIRRMYVEGIMPPDWAQANNGQMIKDGQLAMTIESSPASYNDPAQSKEAGNIVITYLPLAKELWTPEKNFSDSISFTWSIGILKSSDQKEAAYQALKYINQTSSVLDMIKNGNSPARISAVQRLGETDPVLKMYADVFKYSRTVFPPLRNLVQIRDIFGQHVEEVIINGKDPQAEMDAAAREIRPLI